MTIFWIGFIVIAILYIALFIPTMGKFWHKHEWYHHLHLEVPHIYSMKKINIHDAYKCGKDNCWAFKLDTYTVKVENERV